MKRKLDKVEPGQDGSRQTSIQPNPVSGRSSAAPSRAPSAAPSSRSTRSQRQPSVPFQMQTRSSVRSASQKSATASADPESRRNSITQSAAESATSDAGPPEKRRRLSALTKPPPFPANTNLAQGTVGSILQNRAINTSKIPSALSSAVTSPNVLSPDASTPHTEAVKSSSASMSLPSAVNMTKEPSADQIAVSRDPNPSLKRSFSEVQAADAAVSTTSDPTHSEHAQNQTTINNDTEPAAKKLRCVLHNGGAAASVVSEDTNSQAQPKKPVKRPPGRPPRRKAAADKAAASLQTSPKPASAAPRLPGRKRNPHPDAAIELLIDRQGALKRAYRALAKTAKDIALEISERTIDEVDDNPEAHKVHELTAVQETIDTCLKDRLEVNKRHHEYEKQNAKKLYEADKWIVHQNYVRTFEETRETFVLLIKEEYMNTVEAMESRQRRENTEVEDPDQVSPRFRPEAIPGTSRSHFYVDTERRWAGFCKRHLVGNVAGAVSEENLPEAEQPVIATYDGDLRQAGLAAENVTRLAEAAEDEGLVPSSTDTTGLDTLWAAIQSTATSPSSVVTGKTPRRSTTDETGPRPPPAGTLSQFPFESPTRSLTRPSRLDKTPVTPKGHFGDDRQTSARRGQQSPLSPPSGVPRTNQDLTPTPRARGIPTGQFTGPKPLAPAAPGKVSNGPVLAGLAPPRQRILEPKPGDEDKRGTGSRTSFLTNILNHDDGDRGFKPIAPKATVEVPMQLHPSQQPPYIGRFGAPTPPPAVPGPIYGYPPPPPPLPPSSHPHPPHPTHFAPPGYVFPPPPPYAYFQGYGGGPPVGPRSPSSGLPPPPPPPPGPPSAPQIHPARHYPHSQPQPHSYPHPHAHPPSHSHSHSHSHHHHHPYHPPPPPPPSYPPPSPGHQYPRQP
ncbi:MAG: hypothetical protein M1833_001578 [Piccolia ochrophora]|nr:MAG: hypothetical protein M1833_001578 [Piccolia ochrophora]